MEKLFDVTLKNRKILHRILERTPKEELVKIPNGFQNNIWWNIAHVIVTQQLLVYRLSNLQVRIPEEWVDRFKKGTVPDGTLSDKDVKLIGQLLLSTVEYAEEDYKNGLFETYNEYKTSADVILTNVEDAITFNVFHEGLHLGAILALQKALKN